MGNTLDDLIPDFYVALDTVSRERIGMLTSVARDARADRVAKNQIVRSFVTPYDADGGHDFTPSMSVPGAADETIDNVPVQITKYRYWDFSWDGEEEYGLDNGGPGALSVRQGQIAQKIRAALNEMEYDLCLAGQLGAARAWGDATATPFATAGDYSAAAQMQRLLDDCGAPDGDRSLVINSLAAVNIVGLQAQAHMAGDVQLQRQGVLLDYAGFALRKSHFVVKHTAGTNNGAYDVNQPVTAPAAGDETIAFDTGTGTILAGDIITNAESGRDSEKYVVASALAAGSLKIAKPGLAIAWQDGDTITGTATYRANLAFHRNAIILANRLCKMPAKGDAALDSTIITDPRTGISFDLRYYGGIGMGVYRLYTAWGVKVLKPEHVHILIGKP